MTAGQTAQQDAEAPSPEDDGGGRRRLRVAYLASSLKPGGSEGQMLSLAERLPRDRFRIDFITLSEPGPYAPRAEAAGARVFSLGPTPARDLPLPSKMVKRAGKALRYLSVVRSRRHDIVDAWLFPTYDLAALTRHLTGVPVVVAGRRNLAGLDGRLGPFTGRIDALARRLSDVIVANSAAVAADTVADGAEPSRVRVIRNGVDLIEPIAEDERAGRRRAWGAEPSDVVIGCVANYRAVKGLDVLVDAVALLARERPDIRLVLVGEGPERPGLEAQIERLGLGNVVHLHGRELDPRPLYRAFDIVAFGSRSEGLPNALLEAGAAGRPIVATTAGGIPEATVDGTTAILVAPDDVAALAGGLRRLLDDPEMASRMGEAGREFVARTYGMDRFVAEFADLYEELARRKRVD